MHSTSDALYYKPVIRSLAAHFDARRTVFNATFRISTSELGSEADSVGGDAASGLQTVPKTESVGRGGTSGRVHRMGWGGLGAGAGLAEVA